MNYWRGSIRGRMGVVLTLVVLIALGVLAVGMAVMLRAERDFRTLAQDRIPAVALAGELAEATGELAALAMQMVADPALPSASIQRAMDNAAQAVETVLASPVLQALPERVATHETLVTTEQALRRALMSFSRISTELARHDQELARLGAELRWVHADVQDQVQGILSDLSFNMDTQLAALVGGLDAQTREAAERMLSRDWLLRDRIQQIGSEAATLTAILLQARVADSVDALEQARGLGRDTLDGLALAQLNLTPRVDIALLVQALERLKRMAAGENNVFGLQQQRLDLHRAAVTELHFAQSSLAQMQAALTDLGRFERIGAQQSADAAASAIRTGSLSLGLITLFGALATAVILAVFVHRRILLRVEALSVKLRRIAQNEHTNAVQFGPPSLLESARGDEIAAMEEAVEVFRDSVRERQHAIERLEHTQRELVQAGKMAALGQMSAAISHEINQPLAAISHRLHNLVAAHPDAKPAIDRVEALLQRITRTIGHLRRIARRSEHKNRKVLLTEPLQAALELLDFRLKHENVKIECDDVGALMVAGDEILLEQVLLNILANALDAIAARETGSDPGLIRVEVHDGDPICLVIRDNGVGLGGQSGQTLTDPFVTNKEPGKGLGLGLSIAFNVMQDMGGHLEINQQAQGGAAVRLRLKRWREDGNG